MVVKSPIFQTATASAPGPASGASFGGQLRGPVWAGIVLLVPVGSAHHQGDIDAAIESPESGIFDGHLRALSEMPYI